MHVGLVSDIIQPHESCVLLFRCMRLWLYQSYGCNPSSAFSATSITSYHISSADVSGHDRCRATTPFTSITPYLKRLIAVPFSALHRCIASVDVCQCRYYVHRQYRDGSLGGSSQTLVVTETIDTTTHDARRVQPGSIGRKRV